ncbi:MAG: sigma-70 family RNA polymerase sigma factor [Planctomycetota bacterium]
MADPKPFTRRPRIDGTESLTSLLESHGAALQALLYRVTLSEHAAEDLMQELFLRLRGSSAFDAADRPTAYARKTALRLAFDWRRAQRRRSKHEAASRASPENRPVAPDPLAQADNAEAWHQTLDALGELPENQRDVVALRYLQQLTFAEIGEQLGRSEGSARALCQRGLNRLRDRLQPHASESGGGR